MKVITDYPIALDSPDHLHPHGTAHDNFRSPEFNSKLYAIIAHRNRFAELSLVKFRILDLGCAGGAFVNDCINDGHEAYGLEGSDYSLKANRPHWDTLAGKNLFTCDVSREFHLMTDYGASLQFEAITAWELLEHIAEDRLDRLITNVTCHLRRRGLFIGTIATEPSVATSDGRLTTNLNDGVNLHQTIKPKDWWRQLFAKHGLLLRPDLQDFFHPHWAAP